MITKKKIVIFAHFAGSEHHGMVFGHYYLALEWVKLGHQVTIIASGFAHTRQRQPVLSSRITEEYINGIRYLWVKTPGYDGKGRVGRVLNLVSFAFQIWALPLPVEHADLVICSSHCPFAIHGSHRFARRHRAKLVFEVRDLWPLTLIELGGASPHNPFISVMQRSEDFAYRTSDRVVSVLPGAAKYMESRGMQPGKFAYIPNGINLDSHQSGLELESDETLERINLLRREGKFLLGYAGRFVASNTLELLLEALALCNRPDIHLVLLGDGYLREQLEAQSVALGLSGRVSFMGVVNKSQVVPLLSKIDALYLGLVKKPIFRFGVSPTKLNDYFMAARPIIYSVEAPDNVIEISGGGVSCPAESVEAIATAIQRIHAMTPSERDRMGLAGRKWLLEHRTYERLASKFLDVAFSDVAHSPFELPSESF